MRLYFAERKKRHDELLNPKTNDNDRNDDSENRENVARLMCEQASGAIVTNLAHAAHYYVWMTILHSQHRLPEHLYLGVYSFVFFRFLLSMLWILLL